MFNLKNQLIFVFSLVIVFSLNACFQTETQKTLVVAIASSLTDVMAEIRTDFVTQYPDIQVQFNTGASGTLQRQIEQQAPIDIFASAALKPIQELQKKGFVEAKKTQIFAENELVLVQSTQSKIQLNTLADLGDPQVRKIAMGNPKTVPAGQYTENALQQIPNLYQSLQQNQKIIFGENVRQVLTYVVNQDVDAGLVYRTDILNQANLRVVEALSADVTEPILYAIAPIKSSLQPTESQQFIDFIVSEKGQKILQKYGFLTPTIQTQADDVSEQLANIPTPIYAKA